MIKEFLKNLLQKGFRIGWSSGKPFDPYGQERTSAMEDFLKRKRGKDEHISKDR